MKRRENRSLYGIGGSEWTIAYEMIAITSTFLGLVISVDFTIIKVSIPTLLIIRDRVDNELDIYLQENTIYNK